MAPQTLPCDMNLRGVIFVLVILFNTLFTSCGNAQSSQKARATLSAEKITYQEWKEEAKTNIRLLPKYGDLPKTEDQKDADNELINTYIKQEGTRNKASTALISLGFNYLYRGDIKTAMYRFNQAWLLDSTNVDIYWGFGAIYHSFGDYESAMMQYDAGLSIDPKNSRIITDKATVYMIGYYANNDQNKLNKAIVLLEQSYALDSKNQNTLFKLSICCFLKDDCKRAKKYYNECMNLGGQPITKEFAKALNEKCKGE